MSRRISSAVEMRADPGLVDSAPISTIRALFFQFDGAREGAVGVRILAAVGEGIGRDVQHPHQHGAFSEPDLALLEFPEEEFSHRLYNFAH
jgi:hypothetical protein